ncbi:hypothetical protein VKT23_003073 [Stygiomarasmius scandens]|uniref:Uncharacterized protein n=1 Tax=Marasmiellus scandens TaxID=2682957 RepID=A0ABR1JW31_9AGAR
MGEKAASRPWSKEEDELLRQAIATHGTRDNWKAVASVVPGRTNKACRKRWLHSLSPGVKKSAWSPEEDRLLIELYNIHGPKWSHIARHIQGRTDDACSKRYNEALDPSLKKHSWTPEEDNQLLLLHAELGEKWVDIGKRMQRGGLACRNRYKLLERKGLIHPVPYYPPESYHLFQPDNDSSTASFRDPTPAPDPLPPVLDPPPFQFSSSSLSAALYDPPRIPRPSGEELNAHSSLYSPASLPPGTPPWATHSPLGELYHDPMSLGESASMQDVPTIYSFDGDGFIPSQTGVCPSGPSRVLHSPETLSASVNRLSKSPQSYNSSLQEMCTSYPNSFVESSSSNTSPDIQTLEDLSSASSSPSQTTISPTSSPNSSTNVELPGNDTSFPGSLLFSANPSDLSATPSNNMPVNSSNNSSDPSSSTRATVAPPKISKRGGQSASHRLSSSMPINPDGSIRPYACGYPSCWPANATTGLACFATSRELFEHNKLHEHQDPHNIEEKPFRCALSGCGRSWKSMNGLQYHLQVSTAHFQKALSSRISSHRADENDSTLSSSAADSNQESSGSDTSKRFPCDHEGCFKVYKTPSGLRYHKQHGHPKKVPMQLSNVPPALVKDLDKKLRSRGTIET